jgi:hypothetical protein
MRSLKYLVLLLGVVWWGSSVYGDVTDTTPYDYDHPPRPGLEGGTYAISASGAAGPDCSAVAIGAAKLLPDVAGTGGKVCAKANFKLTGTGPACALAPLIDPVLQVAGGTYTRNGDGTACFNMKVIGGPLDGTPVTFHGYLDRAGRTAVLSLQDIAYPCPGIPANGPATASVAAFKISKHGDQPPGSGMLPCP